MFWPAELAHAGYRTPSKVFAHGFLTVDGAKMSKSRGTFITAQSYLAQGLDPEWLRYYYAAKLSGSMEDIDLNLDDFIARSIPTWSAVREYRQSKRRLHRQAIRRSSYCPATDRYRFSRRSRERQTVIADHYETRIRLQAIRESWGSSISPINTSTASSRGNSAPARSRKRTARSLQQFAEPFPPVFDPILLKPVLPALSVKAEAFLNIAPLVWNDSRTVLAPGHAINAYQHLLTRVGQAAGRRLARRQSRVALSATPPAAGPGCERRSQWRASRSRRRRGGRSVSTNS